MKIRQFMNIRLDKTQRGVSVLCAVLLALFSSPWSQLWSLCRVCEWMDGPGPPPLSLSPLPHFPPFPSPTCPGVLLVILCPVTHQCPRSFILSLTGKISESLVAIDLTNSSPPFIFTFSQTLFVLKTLLNLYLKS